MLSENKSHQPFTPLKQKIILIIFGLFLFFLLLEIGLRLGGLAILSIQENRNLQSIKQKGAYRILCIGESTTQDQYPRFLEKVLNQSNTGIKFSIIDKGIAGTNTSVILSQINRYLADYKPQMVVAMMGINDMGDHIPFQALDNSRFYPLRDLKTYKLFKLLCLHISAKAKEIALFNKPKEKEQKIDNLHSISQKNYFKKEIEAGRNEYENTYLRLAQSYQDEAKFSLAEESYKKAIKINPLNADTYFQLAWLYQNQGKCSLAVEAFRRTIEIDPGNTRAHVDLGLELLRCGGNVPEAENLFKKAIQINRWYGYAYLQLARLYQKQGKLTLAEKTFKEAVKIESKDGDHYAALKVFYEETGRPRLAQECAKKVESVRLNNFCSITVKNYNKLKEILDEKQIKLVCVQYPMRSLGPLKRIFNNDEGIIFVDNERVFKDAVYRSRYKDYFRDMFGRDFGHCTEKGNKLLARHIAGVILREEFIK